MKYHIELDLDFRRNPYNGIYIALEGIDGSGKTSQSEALKKYFEEKGKEVVQTREPRKSGGVLGDLIQKILLGETKVPSSALQYIFTADRVIHHEELLIPALKKGKVVITDRCFWSAVPYGILDKVVNEGGEYDFKQGEVIMAAQGILSQYNQFIAPDYTFFLDVPAEVGLKRSGDSGSSKEIYETKEKLENIVKGYRWLIDKFPSEIKEIDAKKPFDEVTSEMIQVIEQNPKN